MRVVTPHRARIIGIAGGAFLVAGYFLYQLLPVFRAPHIALYEPQRDVTVAGSRLTFRGAVDTKARLTINREEVYVDEDGNFLQPVYLALGTNVIEVTAEGKFGRRVTVTRYAIYRKE